ncbi:hypothetical protein ACFV9C_02605 [Kribbella sp. NPDC059898]|uniref:hypothetical protein n=1 Tax=Kribbella sp. NPDC059898 TaxID=3346995 RepID=UPI003654BF05
MSALDFSAPAVEHVRSLAERLGVSVDAHIGDVYDAGLAQVISAVQGAGLTFDSLTEHDSAPWNALPGLMTEDVTGEWRLTEKPHRLAATYTLEAHRPTTPGAVAPSGTPA